MLYSLTRQTLLPNEGERVWYTICGLQNMTVSQNLVSKYGHIIVLQFSHNIQKLRKSTSAKVYLC